MRTWLLGLVLVSLLAPGVRAETMMTRFYAFMHAGPGMQFAVTDEIPAQTALDPENCGNGWCRIRFGNAMGWVEQSVLVSSPPMARPQPGERPVDCVDFARTGWPDAGNLNRVCIYPQQTPPAKP